MPKQIKRLIIVFLIFISLFLGTRYLLVPDSFYKFGHYRADALIENQNHGMKYNDPSLCLNCHVDIDSLFHNGLHSKINCQTCHGPGFSHIEDPTANKLEKPNEREFCGKCHSKNAARSSSVVRQIDLLKHNANSKCVKCHNPHSPAIKLNLSESKDSKQDDPGICITCHSDINNTKLMGKHKSVACQNCHGVGTEHVKSPSPSNISKPSKREFCGKCHGLGIAPPSEFIKQVDLKEHNTDMKCVDCHIAHNPLEFK